jgi:RimJ/RimL family protein N-acetyltransferase
MDAMALIKLHLELECVGIDADGCLVRIPGPNPDTLFRVYVARHHQGDSIFFQRGLATGLRKKLHQLPLNDFFERPEQVKAILLEDRACDETHIGKSYLFSGAISESRFPDAVRLSQLDAEIVRRYDPNLDTSQKEVFGVLINDQIVSTCESSRENDRAGEAWVRTLEGFRRRGYARQVTAAWGNWLLQQNKTPFYSHKWDNFASQAVAQNLGLVQYIDDAGYA